jgi:hypothetical protein
MLSLLLWSPARANVLQVLRNISTHLASPSVDQKTLLKKIGSTTLQIDPSGVVRVVSREVSHRLSASAAHESLASQTSLKFTSLHPRASLNAMPCFLGDVSSLDACPILFYRK